MCFLHCLPRARIPSLITATMPTLENLSQNCIAFHAATTFESTHSYRATVHGRDSLNLTKTTDIVAYETHEKRALHCAAVHNREHDGAERLESQGL